MARLKFSEEQAQEIRLLYESGKTLIELARLHAVNRETIAATLRRAGGSKRPQYETVGMAQRKCTDAEYVEMYRRYKNGEAVRDIASSYSLSPQAVCLIIGRMGGVLRARGKPAPSAKNLHVSPDKLRQARNLANLSQSALAAAIGCPKPDLIRQWEKGERAISGDYLLRVCLACNIAIRSLAEERNPE